MADWVKKRLQRKPDYRPKDPQKFQHVDELLKLLSVLTNDPRFAEMLTEAGEKPKDMCEVLDRAEIRGEIKGAAGKTLGEMQNSMGGIL